MRLRFEYNEYEYIEWNSNGNPAAIILTTEQAKRLRDEITKHLRGANRDKDKDADA